METHHELIPLQRTTATIYRNHVKRILPPFHHHHSSSSDNNNKDNNRDKAISLRVPGSGSSFPRFASAGFSSFLRSLLAAISAPAAQWLRIPSSAHAGRLALAPTLGGKVTGTLFGRRRGHVTLAVQDRPRSDPALLLELAASTSALVGEMASGLVRIALECDGGGRRGAPRLPLLHEPAWTMYCNGRRCGRAVSRARDESEWQVLSSMVGSVSVGAGVIPADDGDATDGKGGGRGGGELLYMRARFERVVGSRDSEALYMMNPDGNGGPELCIFLLRR